MTRRSKKVTPAPPTPRLCRRCKQVCERPTESGWLDAMFMPIGITDRDFKLPKQKYVQRLEGELVKAIMNAEIAGRQVAQIHAMLISAKMYP